ncbi:hypothetical protein NPIL_89971 [Nephila pilipes]|uniref:Uncharacterized protein n=1 Tax=Nephila pilipes TaxID=299642 RepID=A0A8X6TA65_NEPPI|nr:hypothetical protein NPIL_89971 [Nephila pilipes]
MVGRRAFYSKSYSGYSTKTNKTLLIVTISVDTARQSRRCLIKIQATSLGCLVCPSSFVFILFFFTLQVQRSTLCGLAPQLNSSGVWGGVFPTSGVKGIGFLFSDHRLCFLPSTPIADGSVHIR